MGHNERFFDRRLVSRRGAMLGALALAGCAAKPVVFDSSNLPRLRRMAVLTPGFPSQVSVKTLPPTNGLAFIVAGAIQEGNRSSEFATFLARRGADPEAAFGRALFGGLQRLGVQPVAVPADPRRDDFLKDYATLKNGSLDAVFDVVVTRYGYYAVTNAAPFQPSFVMKARLVDLQSGVVLMQDNLTMVDIAPADKNVALSSFQDYSDIASNEATAVQALMSATDVAADAICKRLA